LKIVIFSYPFAFGASVRGPRHNIAIPYSAMAMEVEN